MNVAQPKRTSFAKPAHSYVRRPFQRKSAVRTQFRVPRVSTVTKKFPTVDSKFSTVKSTSTADLGNKGKAVKASACWIWRPKQNTVEKGLNYNGVLVTFKKYQYIDTQGRLKSDSGCLVKGKQEKDKIGSKSNKNEKQCSSCGALYTRDCSCSKGSFEDNVLVSKLPENYARCARCGHPVNGPYCQGCTLLREKLEEDLVTYFQNFQNTSESSDDSTNVVNAPQELVVVKQDHGSFVNKIIHTFSSNQRHCFHCKDVLRDGETCQ
nr:hypothetical protein [Tanacetum cinerariifolium]